MILMPNVQFQFFLSDYCQFDILSDYLVSFHVLQIFIIADMGDEKKGLLLPSVILHQLKA